MIEIPVIGQGFQIGVVHNEEPMPTMATEVRVAHRRQTTFDRARPSPSTRMQVGR